MYVNGDFGFQIWGFWIVGPNSKVNLKSKRRPIQNPNLESKILNSLDFGRHPFLKMLILGRNATNIPDVCSDPDADGGARA